MEKTTEMGANKTGIDMSPIHSKQMINTDGIKPFDDNGAEGYMEFKKFYIENAEPLGSVPAPGSLKGAVKSTMKMATGHHPEVFINKLGERLAFERSGVRIYENLIAKCAYAGQDEMAAMNLPIDQLKQFRDEEAEHFNLLKNCLEKLGADPTAETPDADAMAVASSGLMKVICDPHASVSQSLEAMLAIELTDNAAWELLIKLAEDMSMSDMAQQFEQALRQEERHLEAIRGWTEESVRSQVKMGGSTH